MGNNHAWKNQTPTLGSQPTLNYPHSVTPTTCLKSRPGDPLIVIQTKSCLPLEISSRLLREWATTRRFSRIFPNRWRNTTTVYWTRSYNCNRWKWSVRQLKKKRKSISCIWDRWRRSWRVLKSATNELGISLENQLINHFFIFLFLFQY